MPSTKKYEDLNERSVLLDVLTGRPIDITEEDLRSVEYGKRKEIYLEKEEAIKLLGRFRAKKGGIERHVRRLERLVSCLKVKGG